MNSRFNVNVKSGDKCMGDFVKIGFRYKTISILVAGCLAVSPYAAAAEAQADCSSGNAEVIGTIAGGVFGALLGSQIGKGNGKVAAEMAGAVLGGWLGNYIGSEIDRRHCELEKIAKANGVEVKTDQVELKEVASNLSPTDAQSQPEGTQVNLPISTGNVDIVRLSGLGNFASGSDVLTENSKIYFAQMAQQYIAEKASDSTINSLEKKVAQQGGQLSDGDKTKKRTQLMEQFNQRPIVLVGHTDDTGNSMLNQQLSERRARTVAALFKSKGIPVSRIYFRGAGDVDPVADNRTEEGRAANRRVEIIELESREKLDNFIALKKNNPDYLRAKGESIAVSESVVTDENRSTNETSHVASEAIVKPNKGRKTAKVSSVHPVSASATLSVDNPDNLTAQTNTTANKPDVGRSSADASMAKSWVDFGGEPASGKIAAEVSKSMGKAIKPEKSIIASFGGFFVKEAQAADEKIYNLPCTADSPRYGGQYLSLETGKAAVTAKTADYAPGLYQTSWVGVVNGNYLGITPVGVLRANFQPASQPNFLVYANTDSPGVNTKPTLKMPMQVNVYPGEKGILYRMYSTGKASLVCADVILPRHAPFAAPAGKLYYKNSGQVYESNFKPEMLAISK